MSVLVRKLGVEKRKPFESNFDEMVEKYKSMAQKDGYMGKLKFTKEHQKVIIFVELD